MTKTNANTSTSQISAQSQGSCTTANPYTSTTPLLTVKDFIDAVKDYTDTVDTCSLNKFQAHKSFLVSSVNADGAPLLYEVFSDQSLSSKYIVAMLNFLGADAIKEGLAIQNTHTFAMPLQMLAKRTDLIKIFNKAEAEEDDGTGTEEDEDGDEDDGTETKTEIRIETKTEIRIENRTETGNGTGTENETTKKDNATQNNGTESELLRTLRTDARLDQNVEDAILTSTDSPYNQTFMHLLIEERNTDVLIALAQKKNGDYVMKEDMFGQNVLTSSLERNSFEMMQAIHQAMPKKRRASAFSPPTDPAEKWDSPLSIAIFDKNDNAARYILKYSNDKVRTFTQKVSVNNQQEEVSAGLFKKDNFGLLKLFFEGLSFGNTEEDEFIDQDQLINFLINTYILIQLINSATDEPRDEIKEVLDKILSKLAKEGKVPPELYLATTDYGTDNNGRGEIPLWQDLFPLLSKKRQEEALITVLQNACEDGQQCTFTSISTFSMEQIANLRTLAQKSGISLDSFTVQIQEATNHNLQSFDSEAKALISQIRSFDVICLAVPVFSATKDLATMATQQDQNNRCIIASMKDAPDSVQIRDCAKPTSNKCLFSSVDPFLNKVQALNDAAVKVANAATKGPLHDLQDPKLAPDVKSMYQLPDSFTWTIPNQDHTLSAVTTQTTTSTAKTHIFLTKGMFMRGIMGDGFNGRVKLVNAERGRMLSSFILLVVS